MTVSTLARQVGTSPDTVRYYERFGLLREADRTPAGYRQFGESDVQRMRFIQAAQRLGLGLAEIRELLDITEHGLCPCGHARELLEAKLAEIEAQLETLTALRGTIRGVLDTEAETGRCFSCPPDLLQITFRSGDHPGDHKGDHHA